MIRFKALLIGSGTIIFLGLLMELFFLLGATAYTLIIKQYPQWHDIGLMLSYLAGSLMYFIAMATGGYICANFARQHVYLHNLIIAVFTIGLSLFASLDENGFTLNTGIFALSGIAFTLAGGFIWIRHQRMPN